MTLLAPFADIDADLAAQTHALLDNAVVTPVDGAPFTAMFDQADTTAFDVAMVGDYTLRYLAAAAALSKGTVINIQGQQYRVAEHPRRVGDGSEFIVGLQLVAA